MPAYKQQQPLATVPDKELYPRPNGTLPSHSFLPAWRALPWHRGSILQRQRDGDTTRMAFKL